jgi:hypothetical protein
MVFEDNVKECPSRSILQGVSFKEYPYQNPIVVLASVFIVIV